MGIYSEGGTAGSRVDRSGEIAVGWYSMDGKPIDIMATPYNYGLKTGTGLRFVEVAPELELADDTKTALDTSFESDEKLTNSVFEIMENNYRFRALMVQKISYMEVKIVSMSKYIEKRNSLIKLLKNHIKDENQIN